MAWFAVQVFPAMERRVVQTLATLPVPIASAEIPHHSVTTITHGHRETVSRKTLPGYVFVQVADDHLATDELWPAIRDVQGVQSVLAVDDVPIPLSEREVQRFLTTTNVQQVAPPLDEGTAVIVLDGPFAGHEGIVTEARDERVTVLIGHFPVQVDVLQLERAS